MPGSLEAATVDSLLAQAFRRELERPVALPRGGVNIHLVGQPDGRLRLNTPALVVDADPLLRNLAKLARRCASARVTLRPHAKTHKSANLARLQLAAGAAGICCAKLGEAEALAEEGISRILITSPVVGGEAVRRLITLNGRMEELIVAVDHPQALERLANAAAQAGRALQMVIDLDVGLKRTGTADAATAVRMASFATERASLSYRGVQAYAGHLQHIHGTQARARATAEAMEHARNIVRALSAAGHDPELITGGGTGTHEADFEQKFLNDVQAGSYLFMDSQYADALTENGEVPFETALRLQASVISINAQEWFTVDAGTKALSTDGPAPRILTPGHAGRDYLFMGDEHGAVLRGGPDPGLGDRLEFAAPHCDPTVNLHDAYHLVRGDRLLAVWPVTARGACY